MEAPIVANGPAIEGLGSRLAGAADTLSGPAAAALSTLGDASGAAGDPILMSALDDLRSSWQGSLNALVSDVSALAAATDSSAAGYSTTDQGVAARMRQ